MKRMISALLAAGALLVFAGCTEAPSEPVRDARGEQSAAEETAAPATTETEATEPEASPPVTYPAEELPPEDTTQELTADYDAGTLTETEPLAVEVIDRDGTYTTKDDVALYIYTYGELPQNFITKKQAQALGWEGGSLEPYAPGCCIGGSYFGNYEGNLPEKDGREYTECDIDTLGAKSRGAKRIVFSNDGLIYYTEDHYNTFELLYGEE